MLKSDPPKETEAEKTQFSESTPYVPVEELTHRRREYVLSRSPPSIKYKNLFRLALIRLRGFRLWYKMLEEIRTYGTGSVLFDADNNYKANIKEIMNEKIMMIHNLKDPPHIEPKNTVLDPEGSFMSSWSLIILVFILYTFTLMPWIIAFEEVQIGNFWFTLETISDFVFFLDIVLRLNTGYYDKTGALVNSRWAIFKNYLTGMLLIDILSVFPFYLILNTERSSAPNSFIRVIRLSRVVRILRANKIGKIFSTLGETEKFSFLNTNQGVTRLVGGMIFVLMLAHFTACIWYFSAKLDDFGPDTWVVREGRLDENKSLLYLCSFYWSCTVLTTVGFGDIFPVTETEKIIAILWMVCGIGCYSFVVGNLSSVLSSLDQKKAFINEKLKLIQIFAEETKLSQEIAIKIGKKVKKALDTTSLNDDEKITIVQKLPNALRYEMAMQIYDNAVTFIHFFQQKDKAFVADIVPMLNFLFVKRKKLVYEKHKYADEMYFIKEGRVCFIYGDSNMIFKDMIKGSYFGEIELIENIPREFNAAAFFDTELLTMSKSLFEYMMDKYPLVSSSVKKIAIERKKRNIKCKKELVDVLEKVEVRKEATFLQLAGQEKIRKRTVIDKNVNDRIYLGEDIPNMVNDLYGKIDYFDSKITKCHSLIKAMTGNKKNPRKTLPPLYEMIRK